MLLLFFPIPPDRCHCNLFNYFLMSTLVTFGGPFFAERVGEISTEVDVALRKSSSACGKNIRSDVVSSGGDARR